MKFKDRNGAEYEFRPTAANIIRAEDRCGERLLSGIFAAALAEDNADMADKLFGTTKRFCAVLYECSVKLEAQEKLTFDVFCDALELHHLIGLMPEVTDALYSSLAPPGGHIGKTDDGSAEDQKKSGPGT